MPDISEATIIEHTIAFYNLENLFDTADDPSTFDNDFTPDGKKKWNLDRFYKKVTALGNAIHQIGYNDTQKPPTLIGVAEIENEHVLKELLASEYLKNTHYKYVHFESNDERGIDTGLLYNADHFTVLEQKRHEVYLEQDGKQDYTRDILHVKGRLEGARVDILVNHWPSRRAGAQVTEPYRMIASAKNKEIIQTIRTATPNAKIIVMGDFNDDPESKSIKSLSALSMYNPMELLLTRKEGSLTYKGSWNLFDQIIISQNFLQGYGNDFRFKTAAIFNTNAVKVLKGDYKGHPFRTYLGTKYLGGTSDHFPVYAIFSVHK